MSILQGLRGGIANGVPSGESRDPIGFAVAGLRKLSQSPALDRLGVRKQTEQVVFTVTRSGFKTIAATSRAFKKKGKRGVPGVRVPNAIPQGVFDLTPSEDEQMLVDVVTEFAAEVVRPAAAEADEACAAPDELLKSSLEIGLPILGVPEELGGISETRSAVAGTLVAEALAKGDLGLAVAALAPGSVATALGLWGTDEQQQTYLPAFTEGSVPAAAFALNEDKVLFDVLSPSTTADPDRRRLRPQRRQVAGRPRCRGRALRRRCRPRRQAGRCSWSSPRPTGSHRVRAVDGRTRRLADQADPDRREGPGSGGPRRDRRLDLHRVPYASRASPGARCRSAWRRRSSTTSKPYCNERVAFGEPITHRQAVAFMIADIAIELEACACWSTAAGARRARAAVRAARRTWRACSAPTRA